MAVPTVTTETVTEIAETTATSGGTVTADGGAALTAYGVCWNTTGTPTVADAHTNEVADYYNVLTDGSAHGDGSTDDVQHILDAITAYKAGDYDGLYFPAATYALASTLTVPDDTVCVGPTVAANNPTPGDRTRTNATAGCETPTAWLKGRVDFGSGSSFSDLKFGDSGKNAVQNADGASYTSFTRCHFRGGGTTVYTYVISLGAGLAGYLAHHECDHISFTDCNVERNLGVETGTYGNQGYNNICIWCGVDSKVTDITFTRCHNGVSNGAGGHDTGSPRFGLECYTRGENGTHAWERVTLQDCVFEAADMETMDFADYGGARATGVTIDGCLIKGGGYANDYFCNAVNFEMPKEVSFTNNEVWASYGGWGHTLQVTAFTADKTDNAGTFTGNLFDLDYDNGIPSANALPFNLEGSGHTFTGNTIVCHDTGVYPLMFLNGVTVACTGNTVTGNTVDKNAGRTFVENLNGASGNTITPNTYL